MANGRAFRYELTEGGALGELVAGLRASFVRIFTGRYGNAVADELAWRVDLHCAGIRRSRLDASPLRDATAHVRDLAGGDNDLDLRPRLRFHLIEDAALILLEGGGPDYLAVLTSFPGLIDDGTHPGAAPEDMTLAQAKRRDALWSAVPASPLGKGLSFDLVEGTLPAMRYASVKRYLPGYEVRCRRTARAALHAARAGDDVREFKRYLASAKGRDDLERAVRRMAAILPRSLDVGGSPVYPAPVEAPRKAAPAIRKVETARDIPISIDHADVIEAADGRIFVAVLYAGLSREDRLHIQVTERQMAFVQNGISFGGVLDAPQAAIDLLRRTNEAIVVEVRKGQGRREVKGRHVAVIRDDTLDSALDAAMTGFRNFSARDRAKAQTQWMES